MMIRLFFLILTAALIAACDRQSPETSPQVTDTTLPAQEVPAKKLPRVVFLGDSLTAGFGVDADEAFPARVAELLRADGIEADIVNAGVSGDTTAGGLRRLDWLLRQKPDVIVVGLGGNDGLRGLDLRASEENLRQIIRKSLDAGASVLLLGMRMPPNYGQEYTSRFRDLYPRLAQETGASLVPFLLEGVGGEVRLNQRDGIHPTAEGHQRIAENVAAHLGTILRSRLTPAAS